MIPGVVITFVAGPRVAISRETVLPVQIGDLEDMHNEGHTDTSCWSQSEEPLSLATNVEFCADRDLRLAIP